MEYKKLIPSKKLRIKILGMLSWIPDSVMVSLQYRIKTGRKLNLTNPQRFTEKLQAYKLKYRNPLMLRCTDKYEVRKVVEDYGLGDILIPIIGVYDDFESIDFEALPDEFVAKTTDGGGGVQVYICRKKTESAKEELRDAIKGWMGMTKMKSLGREWAYDNGFKRRIIIEKLIKTTDNTELVDYKFFCFNGKVRMVYGINGRHFGRKVKLGIYSPDFKMLDAIRNDEFPPDGPMPKPKNYERMIKIAETLSKPFPHVRVDLYNADGDIYFGELTFYDGCGFMTFSPDSFDFELGAWFTQY